MNNILLDITIKDELYKEGEVESLDNLVDATLVANSGLEGHPEILVYGLCEHFNDKRNQLDTIITLLSTTREILNENNWNDAK